MGFLWLDALPKISAINLGTLFQKRLVNIMGLQDIFYDARGVTGSHLYGGIIVTCVHLSSHAVKKNATC